MRRSHAAVLALAAIAAVVPGCGGEGDGTELPADIGGICETVADRFAAIQAQPAKTYADAEAQLEALVAVAEAGDDALAEADPTDADDNAYAAYLEARAAVTERLRRALEAVRAEDERAYGRLLDEANSEAGERRRLARIARLQECARSSGRRGGG